MEDRNNIEQEIICKILTFNNISDLKNSQAELNLEKLLYIDQILGIDILNLGIHDIILSSSFFLDYPSFFSKKIQEIVIDIVNDYHYFFDERDFMFLQKYSKLKSPYSILLILIETCYFIEHGINPKYFGTSDFNLFVKNKLLPYSKRIGMSHIESILHRYLSLSKHNIKRDFEDELFGFENLNISQLSKENLLSNIEKSLRKIEKRLKQTDICCECHINNKLLRFNHEYEDIEAIEDYFAFVSIEIYNFDNIEQLKKKCWDTYSAITDIYMLRPDRIRDWISRPRSDGKRGLELTVIGENGEYITLDISGYSPNDFFNVFNDSNISVKEFLKSKFEILNLKKYLKKNIPILNPVKNKNYLVKRFKCFDELLNCMMQLKDFALKEGYYLLYRGQQKDYPLKPSLFRKDFISKAHLENYEKAIFKEFLELGYQLLVNNMDLHKIDKLAIGQHHGLPTRLLDWTENPLIAIWFACQDYMKYPENNPIVWCALINSRNLAEENINPFTNDKLSFYKPPYLINRIQSQSGWFSIHPVERKNEDICHNKDNILYVKFSLKKENKHEAVRRLNCLNMNSYTIMGDLDGLTSWIKSKNEL